MKKGDRGAQHIPARDPKPRPERKAKAGREIKQAEKTEERRANKDEREVVLLALLSYEKNGTFSNVLVKRTLDDCMDMSTAERAFIKRLLEGVIERLPQLDAKITQYTGKSVRRLHPVIRQLLRMGLYQILFMDAVPDSAACNEAVLLAKRHAPSKLSGFVNGVLRNAARDAAGQKGPAVRPEKKADADLSQRARKESALSAPALRFSMPEWLVRMWKEQLGEAQTESLLESLLEIRPVSIRLCNVKTPEEKKRLLVQLEEAGVRVEKGRWLPDSYRLFRTSDLRKLPGFAQGLWTVQDESSMLAVTAAGLHGCGTVFDVCAAPGGKSFFAAQILRDGKDTRGAQDLPSGQDPDAAQTLPPGQDPGTTETLPPGQDPDTVQTLPPGQDPGTAETLPSGKDPDAAQTLPGKESLSPGRTLHGGTGIVYSFDLTRTKTDRIREGAARLHLTNLSVRERDARVFCPEFENSADVLLCDLPCSGLGVIGKKRDIKYRASLEGIAALRDLQRQILSNTVRYLREGGVLLYSTCTISRLENEENAAWIESELGLVPDSLAPYLPAGLPGIRGHMLQLLPDVHGTDGFFLARFRKRSAKETIGG